MKKILILMLVMTTLAITSPVFAGGGQCTNTVHGEDGDGSTWSNHVSDVCPWPSGD